MMGFTEEEIVRGGVVLYCTFIMNCLESGVAAREAAGKGKPRWSSEEVVSVLASRCGSMVLQRGGSSVRRKGAGSRAPITSVGSVLRMLGGEKGPLGSGEGSGGS